jgi:DNA-binding ferritin-like protein (Dps family)
VTKKEPINQFYDAAIESANRMSRETDDAYDRIKAMLGESGPTKRVNLEMKAAEKTEFYHQILARLRSNDLPENIARDIIGFVDDLLKDKQDEATGKKGPAGPVFRRVSE